MKNFRLISPRERLSIDPTLKGRSYVSKYPFFGEAFNTPSAYYTNHDKIWAKYAELCDTYYSDRHQPYFSYNKEMHSKVGPQGGYYSRSEMISKIEQYYIHANPDIDWSNDNVQYLIQARDYLMTEIKALINQFGYPQVDAVNYNLQPTFSGLPACATKGTYVAETLGASQFRHMYPTIPGQRRMRNKNRVIFMDSVLNVRYIEKEMTATRNWLKNYLIEYFSAWRNPIDYLNASVSRALYKNSAFIETDYEAMDQHFSFEVVKTLILPIYEIMIPQSFLSFAAAIEELFTQPIYMGNGVYTGLHTLLSGAIITNDFETIYSVILCLAALIRFDHIDDATILALGDDITMAVWGTKNNKAFAEKIMHWMINTSNAVNMKIHDDEKSRVSQGETRFCRRVYYPGAVKDINNNIKGNYPTVLALNSILNPERSARTSGIAAIADLQRLDNCYGTPEWASLVQLLLKYSNHKFLFTEDDIAQYPADWWERLYGERWDPLSSPTYKYIRHIRKYNDM